MIDLASDYRSPKLGLTQAVGLIFIAYLHEKKISATAFREAHYFHFGVQNHSLSVKLWNKKELSLKPI